MSTSLSRQSNQAGIETLTSTGGTADRAVRQSNQAGIETSASPCPTSLPFVRQSNQAGIETELAAQMGTELETAPIEPSWD